MITGNGLRVEFSDLKFYSRNTGNLIARIHHAPIHNHLKEKKWMLTLYRGGSTVITFPGVPLEFTKRESAMGVLDKISNLIVLLDFQYQLQKEKDQELKNTIVKLKTQGMIE